MLCLLQCILLRVYSICVALMAMLSRVYSPQVPLAYVTSVPEVFLQ